MENNFKILSYGGEYTISLNFVRYSYDNSLAITSTTRDDGFEEPFATLSVCLTNFSVTDAYAFWVDTNNCPWARSLLVAYNIATPTGRVDYSGYCEYPQFKLTAEWEEYVKNLEK